ncbi:hypothetical protein SRHO_G00257770 [Serrasalmus rhombeus]
MRPPLIPTSLNSSKERKVKHFSLSVQKERRVHSTAEGRLDPARSRQQGRSLLSQLRGTKLVVEGMKEENVGT